MEEDIVNKKHRAPHSGRKAEKKKAKKNEEKGKKSEEKGEAKPVKQKNPKAFGCNSAVAAARQFRRRQDIQAKKHRVPVIDRTPLEPPPVLVAVVGPPKVGKTTLIKGLLRSYTRHPVSSIKGPVTVVSGRKRRITFIECNNDINCMIDLAKVCDLALLLIDASFGFEMEVFEFLNICQVHGMPKIMGVLTHLDLLKRAAAVKNAKKKMKHRFWTEVYDGAKLFYLSGILHEEYLHNEVRNLGRFISVSKFRPLVWQSTHPYLLADRMEDLTSPELIRQNSKVDRCISLYGYMRGIPLNKATPVHIPGCGDFRIKDISPLPDPCPLPSQVKKRALIDKERPVYAPFSGVGGIVYDKDAVYIELPGGAANSSNKTSDPEPAGDMVSSLLETKETLDSKMAQSELQLFSNTAPITASEFVRDMGIVDNLPDGVNVERVIDNGRERRKVLFSNNGNEDGADGNGMESDDDNSEDNEMDEEGDNSDDDEDLQSEDDDGDDNNKLNSNESLKDESGDEELEADTGIKWKSNLAQKASDAFLERQATSVNLWKLVYGDTKRIDAEANNEEEDEEDCLFKMVKEKEEQKILQKDTMNTEDVTKRFTSTCNKLWTSPETCVSIKDCFITGKWKSSEDAFKLAKNGDMSYDDGEFGDEDLDGDFEDFETGEVHKAKETEEKADSGDESDGDDGGNKKKISDEEERLEKKKKLKARFNLAYDDGETEEDKKNYYEELKEEAIRQAEFNRSEFEGLDDSLRIQVEGFRAGLYVRIEFESMPCEMVDNFDPTYPVIIGSLQPGEENIGFVKARVKKHRWFNRILKTKDPLILSLGWRRFQTIPIYSKLEDNFRLRMLKYTPQHVACMVHFWGPLTHSNTGLLAVQDLSRRQEGFRIVMTGTVLDTNQSTEITKKLKLVGAPFKIGTKSAFIRGMFNSKLEVAKFEGARIKTVSGIRGQIKKAVNEPAGAFRATFEDKLQLSDIVFCRTWFKVEVPKFYNPITSLLLPLAEKHMWQGMKSMWQLKKENNIQNEAQIDSIYTEIKRGHVTFEPLRIPRKLQKELPYRDKPKHKPKSRQPKVERVAIVRDLEEAKVASLMKKVRTNYQAKVMQKKKEMSENLKKYRKIIKLQEEQKQKKMKEKSKEYFIKKSQLKARLSKTRR